MSPKTPAQRQAARRARLAALKGREAGRVGRPAVEHEHGTNARYLAGCRGANGCEPCREAHRVALADYRAGLTSK